MARRFVSLTHAVCLGPSAWLMALFFFFLFSFFVTVPLVAGYVAVFISNNDPSLPFKDADLSSHDFVLSMIDYLKRKAYWSHPGGPKVFWNRDMEEIQDDLLFDCLAPLDY